MKRGWRKSLVIIKSLGVESAQRESPHVNQIRSAAGDKIRQQLPGYGRYDDAHAALAAVQQYAVDAWRGADDGIAISRQRADAGPGRQ